MANGLPGSTKYRTEAKRAIVLLSLEKGMSRAAAAATAGMHRVVLYEWIAADDDLRMAVESAEEAAEAFYVNVVKDAAPKSWQAAAWWLERGPKKKRYAAIRGDKPFIEEGEGGPVSTEVEPIEEVVARVGEVLEVLAGAGVSPSDLRRKVDSADDAVHPAPTNGKANGVPAAR